jgi:zinc/manganese transport system substrate-binding protein
MRNICTFLALWLIAALPARADDAPLHVVATLPHLAEHARAVGGARVEVVNLARGDQDPHFVQATPTLMVEANKADLYIEEGLELELWSEHVLDGARNAKVRVGAPGHVFASQGVPVLEKPTVVSRAQGDVHPNGNPHVWLDPLNAILEARNIADALKVADAAHAAEFEEGFKAYAGRIEKAFYGEEIVRLLGSETLEKLQRKETLDDFLAKKQYKGAPLSEKLGGWKKKLAPYRGAKVIGYHKEWSYFVRCFGIEIVQNLEPKPGIPPTPGHLAELEALVKTTKISAILVCPYNNVGVAESFGERTGIPVALMPPDVGGTPEAKDYVSLMDTIVDKLAAALEKGGAK